MKLEETVTMMLSANYKERFRAEYLQLRIRTEGLEKMVDKWDKGKLNFTPTCPRSIYDIQLKGMREYLTILEARAEIEGIVI